MKFGLMVFAVFLTGCSLNLSDVRTREAACILEGGTVERYYLPNTKEIGQIYCWVDGAKYWVAPSGKLK